MRSDEGPPALEQEADVMVDGTDGVRDLLRALLDLSRGCASSTSSRRRSCSAPARRRCSPALTVIGIAAGDPTTSLIEVAVGWWIVAALIGAWLGRRNEASPPIARLLADARMQMSLPELRPGLTLLNRLWPLLLLDARRRRSRRSSSRRWPRWRRASRSSGRSPGGARTAR